MSRCERCPAGWEKGGMTDCGYECDSYGCRILGYDMLDDNCKLSKKEIEKRLKQLEDYEAGKIDRPQWVANRFMRELDHSARIHDGPSFSYSYPPVRMTRGVYFPLMGSTDMYYERSGEYRRGYEDAKAGKEPEYT